MQSHAFTQRANQASEYPSLLERAHQKGLRSLATEILSFPGDYNGHHAVVRVLAIFSDGSFAALGEASKNGTTHPGELLELAELRAKARVFEDALSFPHSPATSQRPQLVPAVQASTKQPSQPPEETPGKAEAHTSAQRRFLFRLVVERGSTPEQAKGVICALAGTRSIEAISKRIASDLIDGLNSGRIELPGA